jgi:hypothetical protein
MTATTPNAALIAAEKKDAGGTRMVVALPAPLPRRFRKWDCGSVVFSMHCNCLHFRRRRTDINKKMVFRCGLRRPTARYATIVFTSKSPVLGT